MPLVKPEDLKKPRQSRMRGNYTDEDVARGLTMLAMCGGNASLAERRLKEEGHPVPNATLRAWRLYRHPERYEQIVTQHKEAIDQKIANEARDLIGKYAEVERKALDATERAIDAGDVKDPSVATRNMAVSKAVNIDKLMLMEGRPTGIVEHRNPEEILRKLDSLGFTQVIDSTATEVKPEQIEQGGS